MMLKRSYSRRNRNMMSLVGQVKNSITHQGIPNAKVKIVSAPDSFIDRVILKAKLFDLSGLKNQVLQSLLEDSTLSPERKYPALQTALDQLQSTQLERTQTTSDGWFYFVDLPTGNYQLEASLPGTGLSYASAIAEIEVSEPSELSELSDRFEKMKVTLDLKPTTLLGKIITNDDYSEAIGMVKIQICETGQQTFSSKEVIKQQSQEWNYRLMGIGINTITLNLSAKGYIPVRQQVHLELGKVTSLNFQLVSQ